MMNVDFVNTELLIALGLALAKVTLVLMLAIIAAMVAKKSVVKSYTGGQL